MEELSPAPAEPISTPEAPENTVESPSTESVAESKPVPTRREALENAFKSVDKEDAPKTAPKAEAEKAPDPVKSEQPRGPDGKFTVKDTPEATHDAPKVEKQADTAETEKKTPEKPSVSAAPARFSADAKQAWKDAPQSIQGEIHRAITEMEAGLAQKDEALRPLQPYMEMAEQRGTTVDAALANYTRIDALLQQDPRAGFTHLARSVGLSPQQVAALLTGQQPGQSDPRDAEIARLNQSLDALRGQVGQVSQNVQQQSEQAVLSQVQQFAAESPRFEELSNEITRLLETGYATTLPDAYKIAEQLNPAPQPDPVPAPPPPAQTREAKSVVGAPSSGSNPAQRQPSATRKQALERAMSQAGF